MSGKHFGGGAPGVKAPAATLVAERIRSELPAYLSRWGLHVDSVVVQTSLDGWPLNVSVRGSAFIECLELVLEEEIYQDGSLQAQANGAMNVICALIEERIQLGSRRRWVASDRS